ncbi:MAG: response regulator [Bacteroidia bacterium]|nr:response regulator [Bacteroidia bacterium]
MENISNSNINIYIVEDESIVAKDIQNSLKKLGYNVLGISNNGADAIKNIVDLEPNIVLMDIMIKGPMTGIDVAETIKKEYNIPVIFLTAYADESTLAKAKITEPYGYILKPFKEIDLHSTIEMALYKHKKDTEVQKERDFLYSLVENKDDASKDILFVKSNSRLVKVNLKDIFYVEALKDYVVLNTQYTRYTIHSTMKDIEKKLDNGDFIRVHRSFIVRIDKIQTIENQTVVLEENKKVIPIGGLYRDELLARLNMI